MSDGTDGSVILQDCSIEFGMFWRPPLLNLQDHWVNLFCIMRCRRGNIRKRYMCGDMGEMAVHATRQFKLTQGIRVGGSIWEVAGTFSNFCPLWSFSTWRGALMNTPASSFSASSIWGESLSAKILHLSRSQVVLRDGSSIYVY